MAGDHSNQIASIARRWKSGNQNDLVAARDDIQYLLKHIEEQQRKINRLTKEGQAFQEDMYQYYRRGHALAQCLRPLARIGAEIDSKGSYASRIQDHLVALGITIEQCRDAWRVWRQNPWLGRPLGGMYGIPVDDPRSS